MSKPKLTTKSPAQPPTAEPNPKPSVAKKPQSTERQLSLMQTTVCDLAGDLIVHGGRERDLNLLLSACLGHSWMRRFPDFPKDAHTREKNADDYATDHRADWKRRVMSQWPEQPREWTARPVPTTVSERMRANVQDDLREYFDEFLGEATGEEQRLMLSVLQHREGIAMMPGLESNGEVYLAEAFSYQIEARKYIQAAPEHEELIERYIQLLEQGDDRDSAA